MEVVEYASKVSISSPCVEASRPTAWKLHVRTLRLQVQRG